MLEHLKEMCEAILASDLCAKLAHAADAADAAAQACSSSGLPWDSASGEGAGPDREVGAGGGAVCAVCQGISSPPPGGGGPLAPQGGTGGAGDTAAGQRPSGCGSEVALLALALEEAAERANAWQLASLARHALRNLPKPAAAAQPSDLSGGGLGGQISAGREERFTNAKPPQEPPRPRGVPRSPISRGGRGCHRPSQQRGRQQE